MPCRDGRGAEVLLVGRIATTSGRGFADWRVAGSLVGWLVGWCDERQGVSQKATADRLARLFV